MTQRIRPSAALRRGATVVFTLTAVVSIAGMDRVRDLVGVTAAVEEFGVTGKGVIVAILDRGIDWKNPDFRDDEGRTRILSIFDLTDDAGAQASGNGHGMGTIYSREDIDSALVSGNDLRTRDAVGHGTMTTSIAAGNGRGSAGRKLRGIAPNAWIIAVKVTSDGAPAHDDQPAEQPYWRPERVPVAMDFVRERALQLNMPVVMLLNVGSVGGPADGTSQLARKVDEITGEGKPGLVFVTGAGDDGGRDNRARAQVRQGSSTVLRVVKESADGVMIDVDLWYGGSDRYSVKLETPGGSAGPFAGPGANSQRTTHEGSGYTLWHNGSDADFHRAENGKRQIFWRINGPPGAYVLELVGERVEDGWFDAVISGNPADPTQPPFNRFTTFVEPGGTIWEMATARNNVAPNSFVFRTEYVDIDGRTRRLEGDGPIGTLWTGSSIGPSWDGRTGIDVAAPGQHIMTAYNPKSFWATLRYNLVSGGGSGTYGRAGAVSAAAPVVTGVIALMLECNPKLTAVQVKSILRRTATTDEFTGEVPNSRWGYGKLNAHNAVAESKATAASCALEPTGDADGDGLSNEFEAKYGLDPFGGPWSSAGDDPDGDGRTNLQELQDGTHPRGFVITYLAEGATGTFFDTRLAIANPTAQAALELTRFQRGDGSTIRDYRVVPPMSRTTIDVDQVPGLEAAEFSTVVEADVQVVADRTMTWGEDGYGSHAERGILSRTATKWFFAEGATIGRLNLFYLIQNPNSQPAEVKVNYLLPTGTPLVEHYTVGGQSLGHGRFQSG